MTSLTETHTADEDALPAPEATATPALPPRASRTDGSGPRPVSTLAAFQAAGFDTRRSRSWLAAISFHEREGHLNVPLGHRELDINLYSAIAGVRAKYRAKKLTNAEIVAWDSIGMNWRKRHTVLTKRQRAEVVRRYNQPNSVWSIRKLAAAFRCSYGTIHRILDHADDVELRARGGARTPRAKGRR